MAEHKRYSAILGCPECGSMARIQFDEVADPEGNDWDLDMRILGADAPFRVENDKVICGDCGSEVRSV